MKEEALKLADWLEDGEVEKYDIDEASTTIRKLVAVLEAYEKLSDANKIASPPPKKKPLSYEEIQQIYMDIFKWEIKSPKDNWVLLVREIERRLTDGKKI